MRGKKTKEILLNFILFISIFLQLYNCAYGQQNNRKKSKSDSIQKSPLVIVLEHLENQENVIEMNALKNQLKLQKTIISFALALFGVSLIFIYYYAESQQSRLKLKYANDKMIIDILRTRFKPHFTFNVLSVIHYFVEKKEFSSAANAITKLSKLMRMTLVNMNKELVTYESEYRICQNYMYLESLRFKDKFDYHFSEINSAIINNWLVPPGLIEPLLENCVNHAFKGKMEKGLIEVEQTIEGDVLVITVKDNGMGINQTKINNKNSFGLKITKDYIKVASQLYQVPISISFVEESGTKVCVKIPKILKPINIW